MADTSQVVGGGFDSVTDSVALAVWAQVAKTWLLIGKAAVTCSGPTLCWVREIRSERPHFLRK